MGDTPHKQATSFDVARLAGVSRSAVSRAFTDGASISKETRDKVMAAAEELGYRVNYLARGLQTRHSNLVGVVASRLETPFRSRQVKAAVQALVREGLRPILLTAETAEEVATLVESLLNYSVAGMLITSDTPHSSIINECNKLAIPVVLINRAPLAHGADHIRLDLEQAGGIPYRMLRDSGVRRFALLAPRIKTFTVTGRSEVFAKLCAETGSEAVTFFARDQSYGAGLSAADEVAERIGEVEGLFCANDLMAMGMMDGLRSRHGKAVPEDLQIVGFDNIEQAGWLSYSLSTVDQDVVEQAELAVEMMLERIQEPALPFRTHLQSLVPVFRGTTIAPKS